MALVPKCCCFLHSLHNYFGGYFAQSGFQDWEFSSSCVYSSLWPLPGPENFPSPCTPPNTVSCKLWRQDAEVSKVFHCQTLHTENLNWLRLRFVGCIVCSWRQAESWLKQPFLAPNCMFSHFTMIWALRSLDMRKFQARRGLWSPIIICWVGRHHVSDFFLPINASRRSV